MDGKTLKLNGAGLRKKMIFKVYVAGALRRDARRKDAAALISSDQIKSMRLHMLRDLKGAQVSDAIADGFQRNSKAAAAEAPGRASTSSRR